MEILKHMLVKIWLPWKREVVWTMTRHTKSLPDNFFEKVTEFASDCYNYKKKVINFQSRRGQIPSPCLNRGEIPSQDYIV